MNNFLLSQESQRALYIIQYGGHGDENYPDCDYRRLKSVWAASVPLFLSTLHFYWNLDQSELMQKSIERAFSEMIQYPTEPRQCDRKSAFDSELLS